MCPAGVSEANQIRKSGSEGGAAQSNAPFLPQSRRGLSPGTASLRLA
jgi:hypothetical protein